MEDDAIRIGVVDRYENALTRKLGRVSLFDFGPASAKGMDATNLRWSIMNMDGWLFGTSWASSLSGIRHLRSLNLFQV